MTNGSRHGHTSLGARPGIARANAHAAAFNRIELLVVVGLLALLAELFLPRLAKANAVAKAGVCLHNMEMLTRAWTLYAQDNNDRLVPNYHGSLHEYGAIAASIGYIPWATGWLDWQISSDNTNHLLLTGAKYSMLAPYVLGQSRIFKCPADTFLNRYQKSAGFKERVRSVSANIGIGESNAETGVWNTMYKHVRKAADFNYPAPAESWVFIDEHPDSINDPAFFPSNANNWIDQPASYHDGAASLAFADGHAEGHRWVASLAKPEARRIRGMFWPPAVRAGDADISWLSYHTARVSEKHY